MPVSAAEPALLDIGVVQVKKEGHTFQFCGSPAKALMKSACSVTANTAWRILTLSKGGNSWLKRRQPIDGSGLESVRVMS